MDELEETQNVKVKETRTHAGREEKGGKRGPHHGSGKTGEIRKIFINIGNIYPMKDGDCKPEGIEGIEKDM